jgi:hypothetical protein
MRRGFWNHKKRVRGPSGFTSRHFKGSVRDALMPSRMWLEDQITMMEAGLECDEDYASQAVVRTWLA